MDEYTTTNFTGEDTGGLTLEKLMEATKRIREMPPVARRIYFMDRQEAYQNLVVLTRSRTSNDATVFGYPLWGIPVFNLSTKDYVDGMPTCCMLPGIWAEMSDGTYKRLDKEQNA